MPGQRGRACGRSIITQAFPAHQRGVAVTLFAARESRDETVSRKVDFPGIASITVGLTALVLALVEGNPWHWNSARVIGLLALAVLALCAFVVTERRSASCPRRS